MKQSNHRHKAGILLPISALPSRYGIGSLGKEAYRFIDFLSLTGQRYWQILPPHPTAYGDSPYQTPSSMAGNPYFIDLETLAREGLLSREELEENLDTGCRIDYGNLFERRYRTLRLAHRRFQRDKSYVAFSRKNESWLFPYALFMALKVRYDFAPWTAWESEHRDFLMALEGAHYFDEEMSFWYFVLTRNRKSCKRCHSLPSVISFFIYLLFPCYVVARDFFWRRGIEREI